MLLTTDYTHQINRFVEDISQMGVVEPREGPKNDLNFPPEMDVENLHPKVRARLHSAPEGSLRKDPTDLRNIAKVRRFPNGLLRS